MIKEKKVNLSIEIFYLNHQHKIDNYNDNTTLFQLIENIDKFILKNYPKTKIKNLIHKWSELYEAYQKSKYMTVYEFLSKIEREKGNKNFFKFKIGYGGYIYFKYINDKTPDFSILNFNLIRQLINNKEKCNAFNKISLKNTKQILKYLMPLEVIKLKLLNKGFLKIIERKKLKNKFFLSRKFEKSFSPSSENVIEDDQNITLDISYFKDCNYLIKYDSYSTIYITRRFHTGDEEIIRAFSSEFNFVKILNKIYVFEQPDNTGNKLLDYTDEENRFYFQSFIYESNVGMIYFYDYNEEYFYAVNALGDIYSCDKIKSGLEKVFRLNKKEPGINISGSESSKVVVKSYGFGDNIMVCLNRMVIYNIEQRKRIYNNKSIKVIKSICDVLIERNFLLFELKNEIVVFEIKRFEIVFKLNKNEQIIENIFFDKNLDKICDYTSSVSSSAFFPILRLYNDYNFNAYKEATGLKRIEKNFSKYFFSEGSKTLLCRKDNNLVKVSFDIDENNKKIQCYNLSQTDEDTIKLNNFEFYPKFDEGVVYEKRQKYNEIKISNKNVEKEVVYYYDFYSRNSSPDDMYHLIKRIMTDESVEIYFNHKGKFITKKTNDKGTIKTYTLFNSEFKEVSSIRVKHEYSLHKFNEFYFVLFNPFSKQDTSIMFWDIHENGCSFFETNLISVNNFYFSRVAIHLIGMKIFDILEYDDMLEMREYDIVNDSLRSFEIHYFLNLLRVDNFYMNDKFDVIINNGSKFYLLVRDVTNCFFSEYIIAKSEDLPLDNFFNLRDGLFVDLRGMALDYENF